MFGISGFELFLILLFGFLIFGPDKLPAMAKTVGKAIAKFRNTQEEMSNVLKNDLYDKDSDQPFKNPLDALNKVGGAVKNASNDSSDMSVSKEEERPRVTRAGSTESFSERKARYERERAARKAAEQLDEGRDKAEVIGVAAAKKVTEAKDSVMKETAVKPAASVSGPASANIPTSTSKVSVKSKSTPKAKTTTDEGRGE